MILYIYIYIYGSPFVRGYRASKGSPLSLYASNIYIYIYIYILIDWGEGILHRLDYCRRLD